MNVLLFILNLVSFVLNGAAAMNEDNEVRTANAFAAGIHFVIMIVCLVSMLK